MPQIRVTVRNVRHLPKMDVMGKCDPYIMLSLGNQKQQTSIKYSTYDPNYDEEFVFTVDDTSNSDTLTLDLMDWDRLTEHDYIGTVQIDLNNVTASFGDAGDCVERTCSVKNLRDSTGGVVSGHDGAHTTLSLSFVSDDPVKSFSSHSASGTFPSRNENIEVLTSKPMIELCAVQSQDDKVLVEKVCVTQFIFTQNYRTGLLCLPRFPLEFVPRRKRRSHGSPPFMLLNCADSSSSSPASFSA